MKRIASGSELGIERGSKVVAKSVVKRSGKEADIGGKIVAKTVAKRNERGLE